MRRRGHSFVSLYLLLAGLAIIALWGMELVSGHLKNGIFTVENKQYIIFHVIAEITTALTALAGGHLLWHRRSTGVLISALALGMLIYTGINNLGWSLVNDLAMSFVFAVSVFLSMVSLFMLLNSPHVL